MKNKRVGKNSGWMGRTRRLIRLARNGLGTLVMRVDRNAILRRTERLIRKCRKRMMAAFHHPERNDYHAWTVIHDTVNEEGRHRIRKKISKFGEKPLISIVMPTYKARPEWICAAIGSVTSQLYPHWELCIADDASADPAVCALLSGYASADSRIKVAFRETRGHISAASNTALQLASGSWVALLDHDDLLPEDALFHVAETIVTHPAVRLIYSDEDKINEEGTERSGPYFKPDWDYDLFCSQNLISHLGVYHRGILEEIGAFREGFEGSQDYDLALRFVERIDASQILHIPKILYHWRIHPGSTAHEMGSKSYAALAAQRALEEHYLRNGIPAASEIKGAGYRRHYTHSGKFPLVSLIITSRNALELLRNCIESIVEKTSYPNYEIIVVDNGSDEPRSLEYIQAIRSLPNITVVRDDREFNYSALNNAAVRSAKGEILALINNDIEVITPEWLQEMVSLALRKTTGAVGALLYYPDDTIQHAGVVLGPEGKTVNVFKNQPRSIKESSCWLCSAKRYLAVTAACLVVRKSLYLEVGGLEEENLKVEFNDIDFCLKLHEAGYHNVFTPHAELYHHESASRGADDSYVKRKRHFAEIDYMKRKWGHVTSNDTCFNPNLALKEEGLGLAWPPRRDSASKPKRSSSLAGQRVTAHTRTGFDHQSL